MSLYEQSYNHTSLAENYITDNTIILQYLESIRDSMVTKDSLNKTLSQLRNYDTLRVCDTLNDNSVELEIYLGLRPAEVSALKWCNIRFDDKDIEQGCYGTIVIQNSMKKRNGEYTLQDTKTGKTRTIPIDKRIYEVLQGVKKLTKSMRRRCEDYIFIDCNKDKTVPITPSSIGRCLTRLCDKAKIKSINPTTLRKSFNSRMKAQGTSSLVCSSMLGNDPVVNDKHYTYDCMSTKSDKILALKQANSKL